VLRSYGTFLYTSSNSCLVLFRINITLTAPTPLKTLKRCYQPVTTFGKSVCQATIPSRAKCSVKKKRADLVRIRALNWYNSGSEPALP
jgi:hypothetical protein